MKKLAAIVAIIIALAGLAVLVSFIGTEQRSTVCRSMKVDINYNGQDPLISEDELSGLIMEVMDSIQGTRLSEIDLAGLEAVVNDVDCIEKADVFSSLQGDIVVRAVQRKPLVRIVNVSGNSFLIDRQGCMIANNYAHPVRLPVANGFISGKYEKNTRLRKWTDGMIPEITDSTDLEVIYNLALEIESDPFLSAQVDQIYLTKKKEIELIPKLGRHVVEFGDASDIKAKFSRLKTFYQHGMTTTGWNKYKRISVEFSNQVVCTKK